LAPAPVFNEQAIVDATIKRMIEVLLDGAKPGQVHTRLMLLRYEIRAESEYKKPLQKDLANELGVTEAAVSKGLARGLLGKVRTALKSDDF